MSSLRFGVQQFQYACRIELIDNLIRVRVQLIPVSDQTLSSFTCMRR